MEKKPGLFKCSEALAWIATIADPVTKSFVNMAFTHFVKKTHFDKHLPAGQMDMLFVVQTLTEYFSEHEVLSRTLEGENVGAFSDTDLMPD